ncbi:MAG: hypothetical protein U0527_08980 [Candidatus Eisenbacteria bacterium]
MSEFRQNSVTKEWVIIAPERAKRPDQWREERTPRPPLPPYRDDCPFCPGHEDKTPPATYSLEGESSWSLRGPVQVRGAGAGRLDLNAISMGRSRTPAASAWPRS